jgi:predicted XRE-type DNA-binding protein
MKIVKKHKKDIHWEIGTENVFSDLEMPDAEERFAKAELAHKINQILANKGLKQTQAAELLGVDQSKISLLNRGRLASFSVERLFRYLILLNQDVDIVIKKPKLASVHGKLRVVAQHN